MSPSAKLTDYYVSSISESLMRVLAICPTPQTRERILESYGAENGGVLAIRLENTIKKVVGEKNEEAEKGRRKKTRQRGINSPNTLHLHNENVRGEEMGQSVQMELPPFPPPLGDDLYSSGDDFSDEDADVSGNDSDHVLTETIPLCQMSGSEFSYAFGRAGERTSSHVYDHNAWKEMRAVSPVVACEFSFAFGGSDARQRHAPRHLDAAGDNAGRVEGDGGRLMMDVQRVHADTSPQRNVGCTPGRAAISARPPLAPIRPDFSTDDDVDHMDSRRRKVEKRPLTGSASLAVCTTAKRMRECLSTDAEDGSPRTMQLLHQLQDVSLTRSQPLPPRGVEVEDTDVRESESSAYRQDFSTDNEEMEHMRGRETATASAPTTHGHARAPLRLLEGGECTRSDWSWKEEGDDLSSDEDAALMDTQHNPALEREEEMVDG